MATFKMPALCLVCEKRCDGQFYCSDECFEKDQARMKAERKLMWADKRAAKRAYDQLEAAHKNKEALDGFFAKNI